MRQKLKIRKQKPENRRGTGYFFWEKSCLSLTAFLLAALILASGCATTTGVQEERQIATLTAIDITDNTLNINADKPFTYTIYKPSDPYKAIVELPDVRLGIAPNKIKSDKAGITEIMPSQTDEPLLTKLEILLSSPAGIVPAYKGTLLTLNIINLEEELKAKTTEKAAETPKAEEKTQEVKAPAEKAEKPAGIETKTETAMPEKPDEVGDSTLREGKYKGQKISLDFQDADIGPIFRLLADISGYNFVIDPAVKGKITLKLTNVPWEQALDIILQTFGLGKSIEGNIVWIAPMTTFTKISEDRKKAKDAEQSTEELVEEEIKLNYATAADTNTAMTQGKLLSSRGSVTQDTRRNALIIKDTRSSIEKVKKLVGIMDQSKDQVMIEAKIVTVSTAYSQELGIKWGGDIGAASHKVGIGDIMVGGTFSVNTPVATGGADAAIKGGVLGLSLGSANTIKVGLSLSALETVGKARTLSNPKILTMDNEAATISQGRSVFVPVPISGGGFTQEEKKANLSLNVTPKITPDGYVQLKVTASDDTLEGSGANTVMNTKTLTTNALVKSGETLVLGGIYTTETKEGEEGIPLLSKIPFLGWLFKTKTQTGPNVKEMLIFITPTIVSKP